ncbi:Nuclear transport factor 2, eukaryote,NTF2-like domain [Cinara cedri]|uniref:Nuclear transport factor 2, eukaryote,NTF2-like domain n=1 Tax=Cinara cedri TaxID=506608 RepID=A0A5E4LXE4_9HEMI|nr:Nuclear transport factor 2, eukaryote,NTF2-like domain [Cinara cedri]
MENSRGVADSRRKRRALGAILTMAKKNSLPGWKSAANVGYEFMERYYYVMRTIPEYANEFYDEYGEFQTVYEDGSTTVVKTRLQVKRILMQFRFRSDYIVKSIISLPRGGSPGGLMVTVNGVRFTQTFVVEYRPERLLSYVIVASLTQYISEGPATYHQTPLTTFASDDSQATGYSGVEKCVNTSIFKKRAYSISDNINLDSDHAAEVTKETVISSEITPIKEPDTTSAITSIPEKTASENIEPKLDIDNKKVVKKIINLVLFSAACWAAYKYLKKMRSI